MKPKDYVEHPQTFGEHIKRCRLIKGLGQKAAGIAMGVGQWTVINWEKERTTTPPVAAWPAIIEFLGYNPFPEPQTLAERLAACRRERGWSLKAAARRLGVDEGTWGQWERGKPVLWPRYRERLEAFLDGAVGVSPSSN